MSEETPTIGRKALSPRAKTRRRMKKKPRILALPKVARNSHLNAEQLAERQAEVYRLRVDEGRTWRDIADRLGIGLKTAWHDAQAIRRMKYEGMVEREEAIIDEHEARYDDLIAKFTALATANDINVQGLRDGQTFIALKDWEVNKSAAETLLKVLRQREQLHGLITDKKQPQSSPEEISATVVTIMEALRSHFSPKTIQAKVIHVPAEIANG